MSQKIKKIFILSACLAVLAAEAGLFAGVFFAYKSAWSAVLSSFVVAGLGVCVILFTAFSLTKYLVLPLKTLGERIKGYVGLAASVPEADYALYIEQAVVKVKKDLDDSRARLSSILALHNSLFKAITANNLIFALAENFKGLTGIDASSAILIDKEKKTAALYPIIPEEISAQRDLAVAKLDDLKIGAPVFKERLGTIGKLNELEKNFLEKGCDAAFTVPIEHEGVFWGLLGVASKARPDGLRDNCAFIENAAQLVGLKLSEIKLIADLRKLEEESSVLKHEGKEKIEKQLAELKETYSQVVQTGKMASLGQLSAGVAHELNNPIGGILGYAQLIISKLKKPEVAKEDIDTSLKYLEMMERESKRCQWIISNLLNFARKPLDTRMPVSLDDVINNTVSMMEYQVEKCKVKISVSLPEAGLKKVNANANELQQVFTNLIQNAVDAMPNGGQINIAGQNMLDNRFSPPAPYIEVMVSDNGMGIPKDNLPRIFEPFFTSKIGKAGTGLGLSITYTIINSHNGVLKVESEEGKGTTFTIVLPAVKEG
jgi:two-component system NtrC family sensor kinase